MVTFHVCINQAWIAETHQFYQQMDTLFILFILFILEPYFIELACLVYIGEYWSLVAQSRNLGEKNQKNLTNISPKTYLHVHRS